MILEVLKANLHASRAKSSNNSKLFLSGENFLIFAAIAEISLKLLSTTHGNTYLMGGKDESHCAEATIRSNLFMCAAK